MNILKQKVLIYFAAGFVVSTLVAPPDLTVTGGQLNSQILNIYFVNLDEETPLVQRAFMTSKQISSRQH